MQNTDPCGDVLAPWDLVCARPLGHSGAHSVDAVPGLHSRQWVTPGTDPCGGSKLGGEGCSCDPPFGQ